MPLFDRIRSAFARRTPDEPGVSRRTFLAGAAGLSLAAPALAFAGSDEYDAAWDEVEARAARFGITPGTVVDAQGRATGAMFSEAFIGGIVMFAGNFAPRGWAMCDGQLLPINQHQALFSLLGTIYGGNGVITFALPDLRGRFPMHAGNSQGPGRSPRAPGQAGGQEQVTLNVMHLPAHVHPMPTVQVRGAGTQATGLAQGGQRTDATTGVAGGSQPHDNMPPFQAVNFIIALEGIYPSRS